MNTLELADFADNIFAIQILFDDCLRISNHYNGNWNYNMQALSNYLNTIIEEICEPQNGSTND